MRIIGGAWRGRRLIAPAGLATRPTGERMRQAIFDMLLHAAWGGPELLRGTEVLDAFAGTGALGLEALSRGAGRAIFMECDAKALGSLHSNIAACRAGERARVVAGDVLRPPPGQACGLVFLDPPYGHDLISAALRSLRAHGWVVPGTVIVAEAGHLEVMPGGGVTLARRLHGAACVNVWRED